MSYIKKRKCHHRAMVTVTEEAVITHLVIVDYQASFVTESAVSKGKYTVRCEQCNRTVRVANYNSRDVDKYALWVRTAMGSVLNRRNMKLRIGRVDNE